MAITEILSDLHSKFKLMRYGTNKLQKFVCVEKNEVNIIKLKFTLF
ncbi:hypothetical protein SAMN05444364_14510 [Prevotella scopos JCM 17725]|uniref:Uncharacterized protein n=1 Tax=Prevotella scopos JCM 17725 TaxID=1236518 RepID=A0AAX2F7D7_9BACT|nr:hypothetical protein SAMN05444364_14510 [Prevotella scopos JCM 17725]